MQVGQGQTVLPFLGNPAHKGQKGQVMHQHTLGDGVPLVLGMAVKDYDARYGRIATVEDDPYKGARNEAELAKPHVTTRSGVTKDIPVGEDHLYTCDSWFHVVREDGTSTSMDCSRMVMRDGRYDR